jgi:MerR family transcriptional regulator, copper efflux regulator
MQIGIVAKRIGLSVDAIRFYERNALLPRAPRTQGGFRQYAENDVDTLAFIRRIQSLGFKLSEIRGLLSLRGTRLQPCAPVRRRLKEKLAPTIQSAHVHFAFPRPPVTDCLAFRSGSRDIPR